MPYPFERQLYYRSHSPLDPATPDCVGPPVFQDELAPADSFQIQLPSFVQSQPPFQYRLKLRRSWYPTGPVRPPCHPEESRLGLQDILASSLNDPVQVTTE